MSEPLNLTCRCGWTGSFDDAQIGFTLDCPDCGRDMPITRDEATFKNRNLGDQDLAFQNSDATELTDSSPSPSARPVQPQPRKKARQRAGKGALVGSQTGGGKKPQNPAWVKQSGFSHPTRSERKTRRNLKRDSNAPMVIGVLVFALVAVVGYFIFSSMSSSDRQADAGALTDSIVRSVASGAVQAQYRYFASDDDFYAFQTDCNRMFEQGVVTRNRRVDERFTGDSFTADYLLHLDETGEWDIRLSLTWNDRKNAWEITGQRVRETPSVLKGTNR